MLTTQLSTKGQIVIPAKLRRKYNLKPASKIEMIDLDGQILLCPVPDDPIEAADGFLTSEQSVEEMIAETRREEKTYESKKEGWFRL